MQNYDPKLVSLTFVVPGIGVIDFQQYADGTMVEVEQTEDLFTDVVGSGGHVVRVRNPDERGRITARLMSEAPENDLLSAALQADRLLGLGVGTVMLKYLDGTTICTASEAWLTRPAKIEYAKDATMREWVIACAQLEMFVGGLI
jgi:hypothetical protein